MLIEMTTGLTSVTQARVTGLEEEVEENNVEWIRDDLDLPEGTLAVASTSSLKLAFAAFITPRLPVFDRENTQSPSALLELFRVWTAGSSFVPFLVQYNPQTWPKL